MRTPRRRGCRRRRRRPREWTPALAGCRCRACGRRSSCTCCRTAPSAPPPVSLLHVLLGCLWCTRCVLNANARLRRSRSLPQATDSTWPTLPVRLRGLPGGPPASYSYPAAKLAILDNPALFEKLDCESLFFAFYYQPGSLQQARLPSCARMHAAWVSRSVLAC